MFNFQSHLYKNFNVRPRAKIIKETFGRFGPRFVWKNDGTDTLLDVGCGIGDLMPEYIEPLLPKNYQKIVGYDYSSDMVEYANKTYGTDRIKFEVVDISSDLTKKIENMEKFDHAISTFALIWVANLRKAVSNISDLLTENGDIILVLAVRTALFDFLQEQIKLKKWGPLVCKYKPVWKPTFDDDMHIKEYKAYFAESGFKQIDFGIKTRAFSFETREEMKHFFYAVSPVHGYLTPNRQEEMFNEFVEFNINLNTTHPLEEIKDVALCMQATQLTGYASKKC